MEYNNFFKWVESVYRIDITKNLQNTIKEHFGEKAMPFPSKKCYLCDMKENCIGGCPMFWEYFNPEEYVK